MGKKALLVGCNYPGTKAELKGCINDVRWMHCCLVERYGFVEEDITILIDTDDSYPKPTGANIRRAVANLVASARPGDYLFFHYSGHGTRVPAETGDDDDTGYDECIVPCDMNLLTDDDFREFVSKVPEGCRITIVSDSCHSGGLIDESQEQIGESTKQGIERSDSGFSFMAFLKQQIHEAFEFRDIHIPHEDLHRHRYHEAEADDNNSQSNEHGRIRNRSLPLSTLIEILKQQTGRQDINVGNIRPTLFDVFGEEASAKVKKSVRVITDELQKERSGEGGGLRSMVGNLAVEFLKRKLEENDEGYGKPAMKTEVTSVGADTINTDTSRRWISHQFPAIN